MDMVISINNNEKVYVLPVCPVPQITESMNNQVMDTINGPVNIIGKKGLKSISISSLFPNNDYPFIRPGATSNGEEYVEFFQEIMEREIPARLIVIDENQVQMNLAVTINNFTHDKDKAGDIVYSAELLEFPL